MSNSAVRVLCIVAHPDDAEIALGGAIGTWTDAGVHVSVAICSTSEQTPKLILRRRQSAEQAAAILGHEVIWVVPGDPRQVEDVPEHHLVGLLDALVDRHAPDVVITHHHGDSHADHRRVAAATLASSRRWPDVALLECAVSEHRTPAHLRFHPTAFVPMSPQVARKRAALLAYDYDDRGFRAVDIEGGELRSRAIGSLCGVEAAEPLHIVRVVAGTRGGRGLAHLLCLPKEPH